MNSSMPPWTFSSVMKRHTIQLFWGMVLWSKNDLKSLCSFFTRCNFSGIKMRIWSFSYKSHHLESLQRTVFHKFYDSFKIIMVHFPFIRCGIEAICQMLSAVIFNVLSVLRDPYVLGVYILSDDPSNYIWCCFLPEKFQGKNIWRKENKKSLMNSGMGRITYLCHALQFSST